MFEETEEMMLQLQPYSKSLTSRLEDGCGLTRAGECYMSAAKRQRARDKRKKKRRNH